MLLYSDLTERIIAAAMKVHTALGPGLLESAYVTCLAYQLAQWSIPLEREVPIPIVYEGMRLETGFRADLIVSKAVIVEAKTVEKFIPIHEAQLLTHLKLTGLRVGLLLNFNTSRLADGIMRRVL